MRYAAAVILLVFGPMTSGALLAQFQEDCTSATLDGSSTLPLSDSLQGGDADFTMPTGCELGATAFSDVVVCFTPEASCTVDFTCSNSGGSHTRASIVGGGCATTFATCLAGGTETTPAAVSTASFSLTAGTSYCFVCQNTVGNGAFVVGVTATAGNCGNLPVELMSFEVGAEE